MRLRSRFWSFGAKSRSKKKAKKAFSLIDDEAEEVSDNYQSGDSEEGDVDDDDIIDNGEDAEFED